MRSSLVEPGATESELVTHVREEVRSQLPPSAGEILEAEDIADAILYIVTAARGDQREPGPAHRAGSLAGVLESRP